MICAILFARRIYIVMTNLRSAHLYRYVEICHWFTFTQTNEAVSFLFDIIQIRVISLKHRVTDALCRVRDFFGIISIEEGEIIAAYCRGLSVHPELTVNNVIKLSVTAETSDGTAGPIIRPILCTNIVYEPSRRSSRRYNAVMSGNVD